MILLERIDFENGTAVFRPGDPHEDMQSTFERVAAVAQGCGLHAEHVHHPGVEESGSLATLATKINGTSHTLREVGGYPLYEIQLPHVDVSLRLVSIYTRLVLATFGPQVRDLANLHLVLYELCANILEHGRPRHQDPKLQLAMQFRNGGIEGWIQDNCSNFDPFTAKLPARKNQAPHRGRGLHIVRRLLTSSGHEFNDKGNRLTFKMEVTQ
jgi:anti-sigma regulatory factor (Ser/Thr protein kinase)